jgi:UDP-glucose 4-epimerase
MSKILLTGATGRIGMNLISPLLADGYEVRAFILKNDRLREELVRRNCEIAEGDLQDEECIEKAVKGCDIVIHMGAVMIKPANMTEKTFWNINATGTFCMVRTAIREKVKRFIFASTDATYSPLNYQYLPIDEKHPQQSFSLYGVTKIVGENIVKGAWRETGLPITITRYGSVSAGDEVLMGWRVRNLMKNLKKTATHPGSSVYDENVKEPWKPLEDIMSSEDQLVIPRGPDFRSWRKHISDVRDSVQGTLLALKNDQAVGEDFNILGPNAVTWEQAVKYISEKTGKSFIECRLHNYCQWELSNEKAKKILGYRPQYDINKMVDSALDFQNGNDTGVFCPQLGYGFTVYNPFD